MVALFVLMESIGMTVAQSSPPAITVSDDGSGRGDAQLSPGQELELALAANPTTGYTWRFTLPERAPLRFKSRVYRPGTASPRPGAGGTDLFLFEAVALGTEQLHFDYRRGPTGEPARTYDLRVTVLP